MADSRVIRVAVLQPALRWLQPMPNMLHVRQTAERVAQAGSVDLLVLPESFNGMPCDYDGGAAGRQSRQFLATLARACRVAVIGGSIENQADDGTRRNTCFVVGPDGEEIGRYDKRVLFGREQEARRAGTGAGVFDVAGVRVGVLICGDLWEPSLARELLGRVELLCVPAKTSVPSELNVEYARGLWWNLALTRAMENAMPVVVSDWAADRHEAKRLVDGTTLRDTHFTAGASNVCDPSGRPDLSRIQRTVSRGAEDVLVATIDLDAVAAFRAYRRSVGLLPAGPATPAWPG